MLELIQSIIKSSAHSSLGRTMRGRVLVTLLALVMADAAQCAGLDPHAIYETKCRGCHFEHGADLARLKLKTEKGTLAVNRTGQPLTRLLRDHHGVKFEVEEQGVLEDLFTRGLAWSGVFQHRCAKCHGQAVEFARRDLEMRSGNIVSKRNGMDVAELLMNHGEATPEEVRTLIEMLRYQLKTAAPAATE